MALKKKAPYWEKEIKHRKRHTTEIRLNDPLNSRLDPADKRISELEDRAGEIIQHMERGKWWDMKYERIVKRH